MIHGRYAEYQVLVDGETVIDGGALTALGIVPARRKVIDAIRARLEVNDTGRT
jgi:peptidyl-tRNA hydrolase